MNFPPGVTVHRIPSASYLMRPSTQKTSIFTTEVEFNFTVRSKRYAFVTRARNPATGMIQAVIFGVYLPRNEERAFFDWATDNIDDMVANFESLY